MRRVSLFLPTLIALVLYLPSLSFDRTWDDVVRVPAPGEKQPGSWTDAWTLPYWNGPFIGGGLYRPVTSSTFWLEARIGSPLWGRHLTNAALYATVTGFVVWVGIAFGFASWAAVAAGLLFALHPAHVEVVAGLVGRAEILAALWVLIALYLHDRQLRVPGHTRWAWLPIFTTVSFLAAGSKESAWALPVLVLPLHVARKRPLRLAIPAFAGYAIGLFGHLLLRKHALGGWINPPGFVIEPGNNSLVLLHGWDRFQGGLRVAGVFMEHLVFPRHLSPDYSGTTLSISGSALDPPFLAGCLLLAGILALLVLGWRRRSSPWGVASLAAGIWVGTAFLLTMNVFFNLGTIMADRLLFWPSAGWSLWIGASLLETRRVPLAKLRQAGFIAVSLFLVCAYGATTMTYLPVWKNNLTLFEYARHVAPTSPIVWSAYGRALNDAGRHEEALVAVRHSQQLAPDYQLPWSQEAAFLIGMGHWKEAKAPLSEALRLNYQDVPSRMNEGIIWLNEGNSKAAVARFLEILAEFPGDVFGRRFLALALEQEGTLAEAESAWRSYLEVAPQDAGALNALARILAADSSRAPEAEELARRAVTMDPNTPEYHDTLGGVLVRQNKFQDAAAEWRAYLKQVPDNPGVLNDLAWILATELNAAGEAETLARKAVGIAPQDPQYRDTLAESLARQGKTAEAARVAREALALEGASPDLRRFLSSGSR